jgi:hypothetical protein
VSYLALSLDGLAGMMVVAMDAERVNRDVYNSGSSEREARL